MAKGRILGHQGEGKEIRPKIRRRHSTDSTADRRLHPPRRGVGSWLHFHSPPWGGTLAVGHCRLTFLSTIFFIFVIILLLL